VTDLVIPSSVSRSSISTSKSSLAAFRTTGTRRDDGTTNARAQSAKSRIVRAILPEVAQVDVFAPAGGLR